MGYKGPHLHLLLQVGLVGNSTLEGSCQALTIMTWTMLCSSLDMEQTMARTTGLFATVGVVGERKAIFVSSALEKARSHAERIAHLRMAMHAKATPSHAHIVVSAASFHPRATPLVSRKLTATFKSE